MIETKVWQSTLQPLSGRVACEVSRPCLKRASQGDYFDQLVLGNDTLTSL